MHSAKSVEFDVVCVIHAADGNIPSDMATGSSTAIEEERRLFYVACTRAREKIYVTHPLRYYTQPWAKPEGCRTPTRQPVSRASSSGSSVSAQPRRRRCGGLRGQVVAQRPDQAFEVRERDVHPARAPLALDGHW